MRNWQVDCNGFEKSHLAFQNVSCWFLFAESSQAHLRIGVNILIVTIIESRDIVATDVMGMWLYEGFLSSVQSKHLHCW